MRAVLTLIVLGVVGVLAYNYWSGNGLTLRPSTSISADIDAARDRGAELATEAAARAEEAVEKAGKSVSEGTLTAKIKSKMALDDYVRARAINVETSASVVTLTGTVESMDERDRALRLARETEGVTSVVDKLEVRRR